jgi:hypothetical protein
MHYARRRQHDKHGQHQRHRTAIDGDTNYRRNQMNIFRLDNSPRLAATYHVDGHVRRQIVETVRMLYAAHVHGGGVMPRTRLMLSVTDKMDHPCVQWVRSGRAAYQWTHQLLTALCIEHTVRFGSQHVYNDVVDSLTLPPMSMGAVDNVMPIPQVLPEQYRWFDDPVLAYRMFYFGEKKKLATWTARGKPAWWMEFEAGEHPLEVERG